MDPLKDDWHVTGGIPKSVAIHGRYATGGNPASVTRQIAVDNDGKVLFSGGGGSEVTIVNDPDNPVPVKEKPFSAHTQQIYAFDPASPELGVAIPDDIPCEGFMLTTPLTNTGIIWVGDTPTTCYVGLPAGAVKMCALQNANQIYAFCTCPEGNDQILIVERYFD